MVKLAMEMGKFGGEREREFELKVESSVLKNRDKRGTEKESGRRRRRRSSGHIGSGLRPKSETYLVSPGSEKSN